VEEVIFTFGFKNWIVMKDEKMGNDIFERGTLKYYQSQWVLPEAMLFIFGLQCASVTHHYFQH